MDTSHHEEEHPLSENQTNTEETKVATAIAAVVDPKFPLPTLDDKSSPLRYALSFATLGILIGAGVVGAWYLDAAILKSSQPVVVLGSIFAAVLGTLFVTGTVWIDWFGLVFHYWWLSMPVGALAGLIIVMAQEEAEGLEAVA